MQVSKFVYTVSGLTCRDQLFHDHTAGENIGGGIYRIFRATGALIARAEIALGLVRRTRVTYGALLFALPWALGAMGRDKDPVACQGVYIGGAVSDLGSCPQT